MSDSREREESLFQAALELSDPLERRVFLDRACDGDRVLQDRILRLLGAKEQFDAYLEKDGRLPGARALLEGASAVTELEGPGTQIGKYRLLERLGEGGMGVVYLAEQREPFVKRVALKVIKLGMDTRNVIARFNTEYQTLALMNHPNIARVLDAGATASGRPYFVMEWVNGIPITAYCDQHRLTTRERLQLFIPTCQAIQHAHQKGILHRDIKPGNVLVGHVDGRPMPMVIDFGIAKATHADLAPQTALTRQGHFVGTLEYLAPELIEGSPLDIDTRADIYSLGALLYQLLTGSTPLPAERFAQSTWTETLRMVREEEPHRPSVRLTLLGAKEREAFGRTHGEDPGRLRLAWRHELDWIVMKCLEKDRGRRYETANGLGLDLQRHLENKPVAAVAPGTAYRLHTFVRRNRVAVTAALTIFLLLILSTAVSAWFAVRAQHARDGETLQRLRAQESESRAVASGSQAVRERDRAEQALQDVEIERADQLIQAGDFPQGLAYLTAVLRANPSNRVAAGNLVSALLRHAFAQPHTPPVHHEARVLGTTFSPDGRLWVTYSSDKTAVIRDATTGQPTAPAIQFSNVVWSADFSVEGRWLLIGSGDKTATVWDPATGKRVSPLLTHGDDVDDVRFSPDGNLVATASWDGTARVWNWRTGEPVTPPLRHGDRVKKCRFSPDGLLVATASQDGTARLWDARTGRATTPPLQHAKSVRSAEFSPDGKWVVTASEDFTARVWDAATGQAVSPPLRHQGIVYCAEFSPDGRTVVTASADNSARIWDAASGQPLGRPFLHTDGVQVARFSPDGQRLATASNDRTAQLWDVRTGERLGEPFRHHDWVLDVRFSPDGQSVATASGDYSAILWDARMYTTLQQTFRHESPVHHARFSPDGKRLVTAAEDHQTRLWEVATGGLLGTIGHHTGAVLCAQFSPDGTRVVTASRDATACVWEVATGRLASGPFHHASDVFYAEFSPDGRRVVTASRDYHARLWDVATGEPLGDPINLEDWALSARFRPDGRQIVCASGNLTARIWDVGSATFVGPTFTHEGEVWSAQFSPDGLKLATASRDATAQLWEVATGRRLTPPLIHQGPVDFVEFSPDGRRVATASADGTARVWDVSSGRPLTEPLRHGHRVTSASFSPDGQRLVTASMDGMVWITDVPAPMVPVPGWMVDGAEAIGGRQLNHSGALQPVPLADLVAFKHSLKEAEGRGFYGRLAQWLLADRSARTVSPLSTLTIPDLVAQRILENTPDSLHAALLMSPTNAVAFSRWADLLEQAPQENAGDARAQVTLFRLLSQKWGPPANPTDGR